MNFTAKLQSGNIASARYPVLVVPAFEDLPMPQGLKELDKLTRGVFSKAFKYDVLTKEGEIFIIANPVPKGVRRVAFIGMGKFDECDIETLRRAAGFSANALRKRNLDKIVFFTEAFIPPDGDIESAGMALIEGARLGAYFFDRFKSEKETGILNSAELHLPKLPGGKVRDMGPMLDEVLALTTSTLLARDWANTPGNFATPTHLAKLAKDIGSEAGISVRILEEKECEKLGMGAFLGVAKGSNQPAKFIVMDYKPRKYSKTICLVGKAITFDTGGISLKPGLNMHEMKCDMGGGIAVLSTMHALGILKPQGVRVIAIIPAAENMPSGTAQKPGDIVQTQSGKSIEVLNTDAEGRLVLADGIEYAQREFQPDAIIDIATLTGACVIALGYQVAGFWTDSEELASAMNAAAESTGEKAWRMPLVKEYDELLKSDCADTANIGKREGGAITAALFLKKFVGSTPWMHIDIAGPSWSNEKRPYTTKGATGFGPRLLYNFLMNWVEG